MYENGLLYLEVGQEAVDALDARLDLRMDCM